MLHIFENHCHLSKGILPASSTRVWECCPAWVMAISFSPFVRVSLMRGPGLSSLFCLWFGQSRTEQDHYFSHFEITLTAWKSLRTRRGLRDHLASWRHHTDGKVRPREKRRLTWLVVEQGKDLSLQKPQSSKVWALCTTPHHIYTSF